jgi:hypothetical protein
MFFKIIISKYFLMNALPIFVIGKKIAQAHFFERIKYYN